MKGKKAQAEDIFADFIIALIFIVTTVILISCTQSSEESQLPYKVLKETAELYNIDIITMLESDLSTYGYQDITFEEFFGIIAEGKKDQYPWIFGEAAFVDDKKCTEKFETILNEKFTFGWDVQLYDEEGMELFRCIPQGRKPISGTSVFCKQKSVWLPLRNGGNARLEVAICP